MQQYFVNTLAMPGKLIPMTKEQTHHIRRVMRMQQGDVIRVADNSGRVLLAEVEYHQEEAAARVVKEVQDKRRADSCAGDDQGGEMGLSAAEKCRAGRGGNHSVCIQPLRSKNQG